MTTADPAAATTPVPGPGARFRRSLAVVIGIDRYGADLPTLCSAVRDARAVAETLERDHGFELLRFVDEAAGLAALLDLLERRLPAELGSADRLVFYFAGHGIALESDLGPAGYLIPADASRAKPEGFLEMRRLHRALVALPIRHALIVLDCCFAGAFRWSSLRDVTPAAVGAVFRERYDRYVESPAWQVLTSASGDQLALDLLSPSRGEVDDGHSPFARALLAGLAGAADYTRDSLITADELAIYLREQVAPAAESIGRRQIPQLFLLERHDDGQFVFQVPHQALALAPAPALDEAANPYRGLQSFREQDRGLFFGRDAVVQRMIEAVRAQRLTVIVGPSGCGKSSLVYAGLLPALRAAAWTVLSPQRPGREPLRVLGAVAQELAAGADPDSLTAWHAAIAARGDRGTAWLVVIDQLEELVTLSTRDADRATFLAGIAEALATDASLHVVVTVRADAEPQFHDSPLAPWWTAAARFLVPGVTRDELRDMIQLPARAAVLHFDPSGLVERLIDDVALVPAPLPLLSFALSELYRRCWARWQGGARDRALLEADYVEMGSVAGALTQRATALYDTLVGEDPAFATTIRHVFTRMVATVGGERARRRLVLDELVYGDPAENRRIAAVLQRFHEARLLSLGTEIGEDGAPHRYAEPTHDELVRGWAHVGRWLDALDRPAGTRALLGLVNVAVLSWRADHEANDLLWTDPRIELASRLARDQPLIFNAAEAQFVSRSARLRRRRRRTLVASLTGISVVLAVIATIAVRNADRATREADAAKHLLAQSYQDQGRRLLVDSRPLQALPYLAEALRNGSDPATTNILLTEATRNLPTAVLPQPDLITDARLSPDGTLLFVAAGASMRIYDVTGPIHDPVALVHDPDETIAAAAFSPDGRRIATRTERRLLIWDARTKARLLAREVAALSPRFDVLAWSCDGASVATQTPSALPQMRSTIEVHPTAGADTPRILDSSQSVSWLEASRIARRC